MVYQPVWENTYFTFFSKSKNHDSYVFLSCCTRFLKHWLCWKHGKQSKNPLNLFPHNFGRRRSNVSKFQQVTEHKTAHELWKNFVTIAQAVQRAYRFVRFLLLLEQSSPKWQIPCLGRRWTVAQNLTPLALSSTEKSVTVQTNKQNYKQ